EIYNDANVKTHIATWTKDDKIAWDKFLDPFVYQHEHNNISIATKEVSTGNVISGCTSSFVYDQYGYPINAVYNYTNGTVENYSFVWE
uniref:hypothetical protein n=1 Tax=Streptobacillus moniliformis TaxID=34105 RepID=UPI000A5716F1